MYLPCLGSLGEEIQPRILRGSPCQKNTFKKNVIGSHEKTLFFQNHLRFCFAGECFTDSTMVNKSPLGNMFIFPITQGSVESYPKVEVNSSSRDSHFPLLRLWGKG